jgi:hypothetical protein
MNRNKERYIYQCTKNERKPYICGQLIFEGYQGNSIGVRIGFPRNDAEKIGSQQQIRLIYLTQYENINSKWNIDKYKNESYNSSK